jgi:hypothetical protein
MDHARSLDQSRGSSQRFLSDRQQRTELRFPVRLADIIGRITMLIKEKLPQGHIYPQITQAPINYFDFLNFFRGGSNY